MYSWLLNVELENDSHDAKNCRELGRALLDTEICSEVSHGGDEKFRLDPHSSRHRALAFPLARQFSDVLTLVSRNSP